MKNALNKYFIWQMKVQEKFDDAKWIIRSPVNRRRQRKKDMIYKMLLAQTKQKQLLLSP
jgi:hypothetical protein